MLTYFGPIGVRHPFCYAYDFLFDHCSVVSAVYYFRTKAWGTGKAPIPTYRSKARGVELEVNLEATFDKKVRTFIRGAFPFVAQTMNTSSVVFRREHDLFALRTVVSIFDSRKSLHVPSSPLAPWILRMKKKQGVTICSRRWRAHGRLCILLWLSSVLQVHISLFATTICTDNFCGTPHQTWSAACHIITLTRTRDPAHSIRFVALTLL